MKKIVTLMFGILFLLNTKSQQVIPLYSGTIPNSQACERYEYEAAKGRVGGVVIPTLTAYFPDKKDSLLTAVIICPGGGYSRLAIDHEGHDVAKALAKNGIAAFVLKYRLPNDSCMTNKTTGPLQDAQEAIKIVRTYAIKWGINSNRVGVMGFSAGGHLASTLATHFNQPVLANRENINLRPDFALLIYPVINLGDSLMHKGSREKLLGVNASQEQIDLYSNDVQVTAQTPPSFLIHSADDKTVKAENSIRFYEALLKYKVPSEIHIYPKGGHGYGMNNSTTKDRWFVRAVQWINELN